MHKYHINLHWKRLTPDFTYETYDRTHQIKFGGGITITGSSAAEYLGKPEWVNPEELLAAACSSCHMLTFLAIAARKRFVVDSYVDAAQAQMELNAHKRMAVTKVILRPKVAFSGPKVPTSDELKDLHEKSHTQCFIANSVNCEILVEPAI